MSECGFECTVSSCIYVFSLISFEKIFLNFFGAVILDNLEYEEEKKAKLEVIYENTIFNAIKLMMNLV